jgi:amino acid transporter
MSEQEIIRNLNLLANLTIFLSLIFFMVFLFGKSDSKVNQFPFLHHWTIKIGLSVMCAGALFSAIAAPHVIWQQFVRNVGTAVVMTWGVLFHWKYFIIKKQPAKAVRKYKPKPTKRAKAKIKK